MTKVKSISYDKYKASISHIINFIDSFFQWKWIPKITIPITSNIKSIIIMTDILISILWKYVS